MKAISMAVENTGKKSTGRKKIAIEKLESNEKRQVTFSKRRTGLTNKASELCILCGVEIAIITTSPTRNRFFAFGHPNVEVVVDRFLGISRRRNQEEEEGEGVVVEELGRRYSKAVREVQSEREKMSADAAAGAKAMVIMEENQEFLWGIPIEGMEVEELEEYMDAMKEMRERVLAVINSFESIGGEVSFVGTGLPPLPSHMEEFMKIEGENNNDLEFLSHFLDPPPQLCGYGFI